MPAVTQNVITGGFAARVAESGGASALGFGDSIWYTAQQWSLWGRFAYQCAANSVLCNGAATGMINSAGAGWPVQSAQWSVGAFGTVSTLRPGDTIPADSTDGHAVRNTQYVAFSGDYSNFGSPVSMNANTIGGVTWDQNQSLNLIMVARTTTSPRGPASWRLQTKNRANSFVGGDTTVNLNQAAAIRTFSSPSVARGTGATAAFGYFSSWNENETGWQAQCLSWGAKVTSPASGIFWGYAGHGSWTPKNHAYATGQSITADPPTYTGRWSDDAMTAEILAYKFDTFFWRCGTNPSADGIGAYATELAAWRARIAACSAAARAIDATIKTPKFVLISPYAADSSESYWDSIRSANRAMALANLSDTEHVDEAGYVYDTYGSYATYASSLLRDGVHPKCTALGDANDTLRDAAAEFYRTQLFGTPTVLPSSVVGTATGVSIAVGICG